MKLEHNYIQSGGNQIYFVHYKPANNIIAKIILIGPFATERIYSYISWARWANFLALHGFEVIRFDYSGVGESTGHFEDLTFINWLEDARVLLSNLLIGKSNHKIFIHGFRLGGIIGNKLFCELVDINGLLLWYPVLSARQMLTDSLRFIIASNLTVPGNNNKKTRKDYINDLEEGKTVEVEGYEISPQLWKDSQYFVLEFPGDSNLRPFRIIKKTLSKNDIELQNNNVVQISLKKQIFWQRNSILKPNLSKLYNESFHWLINKI